MSLWNEAFTAVHTTTRRRMNRTANTTGNHDKVLSVEVYQLVHVHDGQWYTADLRNTTVEQRVGL